MPLIPRGRARDDVDDDARAHAGVLRQASEQLDVEDLAARLLLRRQVCVEERGCLDEAVQLLRDAVHVDRERRAPVADDAEPQLLHRIVLLRVRVERRRG
jgi:hypothetical protein